jgi:hypothetical protein
MGDMRGQTRHRHHCDRIPQTCHKIVSLIIFFTAREYCSVWILPDTNTRAHISIMRIQVRGYLALNRLTVPKMRHLTDLKKYFL